MGSSATSPNISPPALSPQPETDADLKCPDTSILEFNRDNSLTCSISKSDKTSDNSNPSTYITTMFSKSTVTQNSASINQFSQNPATNNSQNQNLSRPTIRKTDLNSKTLLSTDNEDKIKEDEDKYPCLRRALSCTETPILPLGTYAVEFGFDVCSLPFKSINKPVPTLLKSQRKDPSPNCTTGSNILLEECGTFQCSSESESSATTKEVTEELETENSTFSICQCKLLRHSKDSETSIYSKLCTSHTSLVRSTGNGNETVRMISPKRLKRDTENKEILGQTNEKQKYSKIKNEDESSESKDNEHSANVAQSSGTLVTSNDADQPDTESSVFEESYWYATKWKKDNRKWLWKCSRRTRHEILACNAMSRKYRRTDNLWLTKPSSKPT